jgi:adenosine deaminase
MYDAPVPVLDLHLHSEAAPRIHRLLVGRGEAEPVDWRSVSARAISDMPPGPGRLAVMDAAIDTAKLAQNDHDPEVFVARTEEMLRESAASGAWLAEARFGSATLVVRPDLVALFRKAEELVRADFPDFLAEPVLTVDFTRITDDGRGQRLLDRILNAGLSGVDLHPHPYVEAADWSHAWRWAAELASAGLGITAHAGDFGTDNLALALDTPGLRRLSDAVCSYRDAVLRHRIITKGVVVECTISGSSMLGAVTSARQHPALRLSDAGVRVVLGSDDPVRMGTSIAREYDAARALGASEATLASWGRDAIEAAFTTPDRRRVLRLRAKRTGECHADARDQ